MTSAPVTGGPASMTWQEELASLVSDTGIRYTAAAGSGAPPEAAAGAESFYYSDEANRSEESLKDQVKEFLKASGEMMVEFGRGVRDILQQSLERSLALMATDLEKKAKEAFVDDDFELAVDLYTQALDMDPNNANLYADRAQANIKISSFPEAVADANKAIELDPSMSKAYLRKGTACIKLEEYQTAKAALEAGLKLAPGDSRFNKLIKECDERIAEETISLPKEVTPTALSIVSPVVSNGASVNVGSTQELPKPSTIAASSKPKYRHDYYNSSTEVVLTIFAKGIPAEHVSIEFGEQTLRVVISLPGEEPYHFQPRLFGKIIPEKCRYQVLGTKIEIRLFKAEAITWTSLEFSDKKNVPQKINMVPAPNQPKPSYPSSRRKVEWDKVEAQVKKEEKEEKFDGDAALNKLFRDIYRDADEDTRRAMMKSFVESNGTVLSTNWKDVGSKKVEGSPPEGMELKKWEY